MTVVVYAHMLLIVALGTRAKCRLQSYIFVKGIQSHRSGATDNFICLIMSQRVVIGNSVSNYVISLVRMQLYDALYRG